MQCQEYYIIGARGFGRELCQRLRSMPGYGESLRVAGFLDDCPTALDDFEEYPPIVGPLELYTPEAHHQCLLGLGAAEARRKYADIALSRGCRFPVLVHPTAIVDPKARLGQGVIVGPYCVISPDVEVADFTLVHSFCTLGHDVRVGSHCTVETYTFLGGGAQVADGATLHTRSTVLPHVRIGAGAVVGAGSVVLRSVKPGTTVFGVPARKVDY